ncbi:hypothetical protein Pint_06833 [Pistacia integerrima]|uniref:Uncharacterized protein n=1 Tax=Pistacia integerrima TaxID=434235 RepID=A0ACC0Y0A8_9ROSI|nr:hypothetical protein Pint_06833 [Pistacia integerrima]
MRLPSSKRLFTMEACVLTLHRITTINNIFVQLCKMKLHIKISQDI